MFEKSSECDQLLISSGFIRGPFFYFRKKGSIFQCLSFKGSYCPYEKDNVYLSFCPFWTVGIPRLERWHSLKSAYLGMNEDSDTDFGREFCGVNISKSFDSDDDFRKFFIDELLPLLDSVYDNTSYKNAMIRLNRHFRVFEEIILLECVNSDSLEPALRWLDDMKKIDDMSVMTISEKLLDFNDNLGKTKIVDYSIDKAVEHVKKTVDYSYQIYWHKLITAVRTGDYSWVVMFFEEEQEKAKKFFKTYFDLDF